MKFFKFISSFLFAMLCCMTYVDASKYVLIEQNHERSRNGTFIVELVENPVKYAQIDDACNTYEIAKMIPVSEDVFLYLANLNEYEADAIQSGSRPSKSPRWQCPYCYKWWEYGEECGNLQCATNQWKKKEKSRD